MVGDRDIFAGCLRPGRARVVTRRALLAGASLLALLLAPAISDAGAKGSTEVRIGSAPGIPVGATPLAAVASTTPMRITVVLKPRDPGALEAYARSVSDPGSALFRRYITPARFARRFGASATVAQAVRASLRAHGLAPGPLSANRLSIPVLTTTGAVERAFSLSLAKVRLDGGSTAVINTTAPALDAHVAGAVQAVLGLDSLSRPEPMLARSPRAVPTPTPGLDLPPRARTASARPRACAAASVAAATQSAFTAPEIASAYGFDGLLNAGDEGQGVTIAVYELESDDPSDLAAYQSCYGTDTAIGYVEVDGGAEPSAGPGSGEAALDIEQLIALAPRARLLVYQGPNSNSDSPGSGPYDVLSKIVSQDRAQVVTNSWGECERIEGAGEAAGENVLFEEAAAQGQTVVSAAGDDGAQDCDQPGSTPDPELEVDDPASQPFVTGVGGTSLKSIGPPPTETVWNDSGADSGLQGFELGAGGGGISRLWPMPSYQADAPSSLNVIEPGVSSPAPCGAGSGYCREVPDVSADADPATGYVFYYNGSGDAAGEPLGWQGTGGTSGAAPVWAAVFALADASRGCGGRSIGFVNPELYAAAAAGESAYFNDVTTGNNDFIGTSGYSAGPGYDMASGLGSPNATALDGFLCRQSLTLSSPDAQRSFKGARVDLRLNYSDRPGAVLRVTVTGLPKGLTFNPLTGTIAGTAGRTGSWRVTVLASDADGTQRRASFSWTVEGRPRVTRARIASLADGRPDLTVRIASGIREPGIRGISISLPAGLSIEPGHLALTVAASDGRRLTRITHALESGVQISLRSPEPVVVVAIRSPALRAGRELSALAAHHPARARLRLELTVTDADGAVVQIAATVTLSL